MRVISSAVTRNIEIELNEGELVDLGIARVVMRDMIQEGLPVAQQIKALENSIYLISTVLGNHQ
jgi:hypothetical protein